MMKPISHKLLVTDTQVSKICKSFANGSSANTKFSKTHLRYSQDLILLI